jgi:hypothetical protein
MHKTLRFLLLLVLTISGNTLTAQQFYRFKSDFSIKEKESGKDQGRLITGTIYFDKNLHKTVYNIRFPEPEQWLVRDTFMYRKKADTLVSKQVVPPVGEFSIFNMILSQQLSDFGLAKVGYTPGDVQQDGNQVIAQWLPPEQFKAYLGPVSLATEQKRLTAAAFYDKEQKLVSKFYFQDYTLDNGLAIPGKIYQIYYRESGEFIRIMTLKNVTINQTDEDQMYDFELPAGG